MLRRLTRGRVPAALPLVLLAPLLAGAPASAGAASPTPSSPPSSSTVTVGPDLTTAGSPAAKCDTLTCHAVQAAGEPLVMPVAGRVTEVRLKHGPVTGGYVPDTEVSVAVLDRIDGRWRAHQVSAPVRLAATTSTSTVSRLPVDLVVSAGQYVGLRVVSGWAGSELKFLASAPADSVAAVLGAAHEPGATADYAERPGQLALYNVTLTTAAPSPSPEPTPGPSPSPEPTPGPSPGPGTGTGGYDPATGCSTDTYVPEKQGGRPTKARNGWPGLVLGRQDNVNDLRLRYDGKGRPHLAARGVFHQGVYYYGPGAAWQLDSSQTHGSVGLAFTKKGSPLVAWGSAKATLSREGLIQYCPRLQVWEQGVGTHLVRVLPDGAHGFAQVDVAEDPRSGAVHLGYDVDGRLFHQVLGGRPQRLPVGAVEEVRVVAASGTVVLAARHGGDQVVVLAKRGRAAWGTVVKARRVKDFDVALTPQGQVRAAWSAGRVPELVVFDGRRTLATGIRAETVGLAASGERSHVAFSRQGQPSCNRFGCASNGIYLLTVAGTRGRLDTVQDSVGYSPARLSVAADGRQVGVAYGDPATSGYPTLRQERK